MVVPWGALTCDLHFPQWRLRKKHSLIVSTSVRPQPIVFEQRTGPLIL